jgi:predicted ATPase
VPAAGPLGGGRARAREPARERPVGEAPTLVGRDAELAALRRWVDEAARGRGRAVLIAGDPGIGKTRLAGEAAAIAASKGAQVHRGASYELEGAPPFWPWVQVVRSVAEQLDDAELRQALGAGAAYVAQVAPELRGRAEGPAPARLDGEAARFRAYDAVAHFLARAAARRPLLLVLDDLHWADLPSLRLLGFVAGALGRTPALVVATYRAGEVRPGQPLAETLARLAREPAVERIALGALTQAEVARLVAGETGAAVPEELSARLHRRTGGNPFLLGELLRLGAPDGTPATAAAGEVPATVREVVGERLARLPGEAAEVLTVAALAPDSFGVDALAAVTGLPAERVLELVEAALAAGLVVEDPEGRGGWRFAHDLVREAVYESQSTARRARLHAAYGTALEAVLGPRADAAAAELAHHFGLAAAVAADGHDAEDLVAKGVGYAKLAAEQADARLAYEDAAGHYERALAVLDRSGGDAARLRCELLLGMGDARRCAGDVIGARACLEPAFELASELGEPTWMARAALGFNSGNLWASWLDLWQPDEPSVRLLDGARVALGDEDSALKASLLAQLAVNFHSEDELSTLSAEALGMARRLRDPMPWPTRSPPS